MTITTDKGLKINLTETPRWSEVHRCYYASGFRWIASKQAWSKSEVIHNFTGYEPNTVEDPS